MTQAIPRTKNVWEFPTALWKGIKTSIFYVILYHPFLYGFLELFYLFWHNSESELLDKKKKNKEHQRQLDWQQLSFLLVWTRFDKFGCCDWLRRCLVRFSLCLPAKLGCTSLPRDSKYGSIFRPSFL